MENISQEQIVKRYFTLGKALQDALFSQQTGDAINKACVLREAEKDTPIIAKLTGRVLLGYLRPENFAAEIQKETGIDDTKAAQVAHDIDTEIFSNVRLELKKLYPPTIQTPTVASQGFAPRMPEPPAAVRRPEPARPYVVPIPEKFRTKSMWSSHQVQPAEALAPTQTPAIEIKPTPAPSSVAPESVRVSATPVTPAETKQAPTPQPQKIQSTPLSDIKPIVPLPTFIQSKFKETLKQTTGEKQVTQENPELKNAITQFTTPHTAAKPAEETPKESVYREQVTEPGRQQTGAPASGAQKAHGKVIDLSGL